MIEKIYTPSDIVRMERHWAHYVASIIRSNKASPLAGFLRRSYTEILEDPATGNIIVRYIPA